MKVYCDGGYAHGSILSCDTLRQARGFMTDVADWCEDCREVHDGS
jgi:hypothetical protein